MFAPACCRIGSCLAAVRFAFNLPDGLSILGPADEDVRDSFSVYWLQANRCRWKPIGEFDEARQARQVHQLVGQQQRLDMLARRQADGVAGIVVAIGVAFFHVANLAMADEVGTPGGGLAVCRTEDQFGPGKRCKRHRHVLTVDLLELGIGMDAGDDCAAKIARRLQAFLESG